MIHYHGTPITPTAAAVAFYSRRHAFVSFEHQQQMALAAEVCQSFALDNGAFSKWTKSEGQVDIAAYADFVRKWERHPGFDFAIIPDVIDGDELANDTARLLRAVVRDCRPHPVGEAADGGHPRCRALGVHARQPQRAAVHIPTAPRGDVTRSVEADVDLERGRRGRRGRVGQRDQEGGDRGSGLHDCDRNLGGDAQAADENENLDRILEGDRGATRALVRARLEGCRALDLGARGLGERDGTGRCTGEREAGDANDGVGNELDGCGAGERHDGYLSKTPERVGIHIHQAEIPPTIRSYTGSYPSCKITPMPRCAVCERTLGPGEQFALQDCYVVHRTCVGRPAKRELQFSDIRRRVADLDAAIQRMRDEHERETRQLRDELRTNNLRQMTTVTSRARWEEIAHDRLVQMQLLQGEVDRLRAQQQPVPVASRPPLPATEPAEQIPSTPDPEEEKDGTSIRYGLLEFD